MKQHTQDFKEEIKLITLYFHLGNVLMLSYIILLIIQKMMIFGIVISILKERIVKEIITATIVMLNGQGLYVYFQ